MGIWREHGVTLIFFQVPTRYNHRSACHCSVGLHTTNSGLRLCLETMSGYRPSRIRVLENRSQYYDWSFRMKAVFLARGQLVWDRVTGHDIKPTGSLEELKTWEAAGHEALCMLFEGLRGPLFTMVAHLDSPDQVWAALKKHWGQIRDDEVSQLERELAFSKQGNLPTEDYITQIFSKRNKLYHCTSSVSDSGHSKPISTTPAFIASYLVRGLSDKFRDVSIGLHTFYHSQLQDLKDEQSEGQSQGGNVTDNTADLEEDTLQSLVDFIRALDVNIDRERSEAR